MALTFYFDTHIAKAVAIQLRAKGVNVVRCEDVDMADAPDEKHLQYATEHGFVMVSQDEDFAKLHVQYQENDLKHAGIFKFKGNQGSAQISIIVSHCLFYDEAERSGAIDYPTEIKNTIIYF